MGHAIFTFLLSIKGWKTYVSIVLFIFVATWIVRFFVEKYKSRNAKIRPIFFHTTTDIVNKTHFSDVEDLIINFRNRQIRSLCHSHIYIMGIIDTSSKLENTLDAVTLRVDMKGGTEIFGVRSEMAIDDAIDLTMSVSDQRDAAEITYHPPGPEDIIKVRIFHSHRSEIYLSGNIGRRPVKIIDLGEPSVKEETNHILILGLGSIALNYFAEFFEKKAADATALFGKSSLQIILVLVWSVIIFKLMSLVLRTGRKRRLLRRLKLPPDAQFAPSRKSVGPTK